MVDGPERVEPVALALELDVLPRYGRLLGRMLEILAEDGWLRRAGSGYELVRPIEHDEPGARMAGLLARYPACHAELTLAADCGAALADVLRGDLDPLQVLFRDGSTALLEKVYEESPFARLSNTLVAESLARAIERLPDDRIVRILEIGAGTGGRRRTCSRGCRPTAASTSSPTCRATSRPWPGRSSATSAASATRPSTSSATRPSRASPPTSSTWSWPPTCCTPRPTCGGASRTRGACWRPTASCC